MTEERVVIKRHLAVERDDFVLGGHHQRVDLQHVGVGLDEALGERLRGFHERGNLRRSQTDLEAEATSLPSTQAEMRIEVRLEDLLRMGVGDLLDIHAAFAADDQHRCRRRAVEQDGEVQFLGDLAAVFDVERLDLFAAVAGLDGLEVVAEQFAGGFLRRRSALHHLHATVHDLVVHGLVGVHRALTASAGVDLRFHHDHWGSQLDGRGLHLFHRGACDPL